jgi:pimeloyl-ACP methyl ester carboxylesterase
MLAVACGDIADLHRPRSLSPSEAGGIESIFTWRYCDWRPLSERPPLQPRGTPIPTLILAGEADPVTPPDFARRTRETLGPRAQLVLLRGVGHSTLDGRNNSSCAVRLVASFLRDPRAPLATGCAAHPPPVAFAPNRGGT